MSGPPTFAGPSQEPDVNKGPWVLGVLLTIRALAIIIVGLRLYTRMLARNTAGWDDAMISISAVCPSRQDHFQFVEPDVVISGPDLCRWYWRY